MAENDLEGIFNNTLLLAKLGNEKSSIIFEQLRGRFSDNPAIMTAVNQYEEQWKQALKK